MRITLSVGGRFKRISIGTRYEARGDGATPSRLPKGTPHASPRHQGCRTQQCGCSASVLRRLARQGFHFWITAPNSPHDGIWSSYAEMTGCTSCWIKRVRELTQSGGHGNMETKGPRRRPAVTLLLGFLLSLSPQGIAGQVQCPSDGVAVQILGSGGPRAGTGRASASYLVWVDGRARVMVDAGGGSFVRFGESGARLG